MKPNRTPSISERESGKADVRDALACIARKRGYRAGNGMERSLREVGNGVMEVKTDHEASGAGQNQSGNRRETEAKAKANYNTPERAR